MTEFLRLDIADGVALITLDRADKRNAINGEMIAGLGALYTRCDADDAVRVVVVTGAGSAFCAA